MRVCLLRRNCYAMPPRRPGNRRNWPVINSPRRHQHESLGWTDFPYSIGCREISPSSDRLPVYTSEVPNRVHILRCKQACTTTAKLSQYNCKYHAYVPATAHLVTQSRKKWPLLANLSQSDWSSYFLPEVADRQQKSPSQSPSIENSTLKWHGTASLLTQTQ